jgi:uncharacterized protein YecT (DUF1311 family)
MSRLFIVFLLLLAPVYLHGASFDCSKARTSVEKTICFSPELSAADDTLNHAYHAALIKVPEAAELVGEAQRKWLKSVGQKCDSVDKNYPFAKCLNAEWQSRTLFLSNIVVRRRGVPFFFREIQLGKPCDEEDLTTGLPKKRPSNCQLRGRRF